MENNHEPRKRIDLRAEFGVSLQELSQRTGLAHGTLSKVMCGQSTATVSRHKIEAALGEAIWSTPEEFYERARLARILGGEPSLVTKSDLRTRARQLLVPYDPKRTSKQAMIEDILKAYEGWAMKEVKFAQLSTLKKAFLELRQFKRRQRGYESLSPRVKELVDLLRELEGTAAGRILSERFGEDTGTWREDTLAAFLQATKWQCCDCSHVFEVKAASTPSELPEGCKVCKSNRIGPLWEKAHEPMSVHDATVFMLNALKSAPKPAKEGEGKGDENGQSKP